jgi:hypothetical protein
MSWPRLEEQVAEWVGKSRLSSASGRRAPQVAYATPCARTQNITHELAASAVSRPRACATNSRRHSIPQVLRCPSSEGTKELQNDSMCDIVRMYIWPKTKRLRTLSNGFRKRYGICGLWPKAPFPFARPPVFAKTARYAREGTAIGAMCCTGVEGRSAYLSTYLKIWRQRLRRPSRTGVNCKR